MHYIIAQNKFEIFVNNIGTKQNLINWLQSQWL